MQEHLSTDAESIANAISGLPEREKLVVTLYYYEELTLREIGGILDLAEARVSDLLTSAVLRLKSRLAADRDKVPTT
jgi:RNA polymerase sigma factor FliA